MKNLVITPKLAAIIIACLAVVLLLMVVCSGNAGAQRTNPAHWRVAPDTFHACPAAGSSTSSAIRAISRLKNRSSAPTSIDSMTIAQLIAPGADLHRFSNAHAARLTGYVARVYMGGVEMANCKATDSLDRDTHIELALSSKDTAQTRRVIVEVTPRWRAAAAQHGQDWSTSALARQLTHHTVSVEGWLLEDWEHSKQAQNTCPGCAGDWRATVWEIHPITRIVIVR